MMMKMMDEWQYNSIGKYKVFVPIVMRKVPYLVGTHVKSYLRVYIMIVITKNYRYIYTYYYSWLLPIPIIPTL